MAAAVPPEANAREDPGAEGAVGVPHPLDLSEPSRGVGRGDADGLEPGGGHADLLEALGVLAEVGDRLADHVGVVDLQLGGGQQAEGRGDDVGLASRRLGEPAAGDPARLDVIDAAQDVAHRAAHVPEDPQPRVGRPQAGRLAHRIGGEAPVRVLMRHGEGRGLRHLVRRLRPRLRCHPRRAHRGQDEGDPRACSHGSSSPGGPILLNPPDQAPSLPGERQGGKGLVLRGLGAAHVPVLRSGT